MTGYIRHNRKAVTCPWEVWEGKQFLGAYQTLAEADATDVEITRLYTDGLRAGRTSKRIPGFGNLPIEGAVDRGQRAYLVGFRRGYREEREMTTEQALKLAQRIHPLDLVARIDYIEKQRDRCDIDDLPAWTQAADATRNGVSR